jgi:hypothetical protein
MDHKAQVQQMLKGLTPAEFVKLPLEQRNKIYERYLVKDGYVQIEEGDDEDFFNPTIAKGVLLRQEYMVGSDAAGQQIAREAREVYYTQNTFTVRSHWLCEFVTDTLTDGKPMRIEPLVRKIMVVVDPEHIDGDDPTSDTDESELEAHGQQLSSREIWKRRKLGKKKPSKKSTPAVHDLRRLLAFKQAEWIGIEIWGKGVLDGSDLKTQQKIKDISRIVKELIAQFGDRFTILKVQKRPGNSHTTAHNLKPYWDPPTALLKEKFQRSTVSFQELMQIQIEEWTREVPQVVGGKGWHWESLL